MYTEEDRQRQEDWMFEILFSGAKGVNLTREMVISEGDIIPLNVEPTVDTNFNKYVVSRELVAMDEIENGRNSLRIFHVSAKVFKNLLYSGKKTVDFSIKSIDIKRGNRLIIFFFCEPV